MSPERPTLDQIAEMQEFLDPTEGAAYDHTFGDAYWWGTPDNAPDHDIPQSVMASKYGRGLLSAYTRYNGGMLRLGDPKETEDEVLDASQMERGTIIKVIRERLFRTGRYAEDPKMPVYTSAHIPSGFTVTNFRPRSQAMYGQHATWFAAAGARDGGSAFFPLELDEEASYGINIDDGLSAAIKVNGARLQSGLRQIRLHRTTVMPVDNSVFYERTRSVREYHPIYVPHRSPFDVLANPFRHS